MLILVRVEIQICKSIKPFSEFKRAGKQAIKNVIYINGLNRINFVALFGFFQTYIRFMLFNAENCYGK